MNLLNIFKKLERITPQHKTVYPPYRNRVVSKYVTDDNTKRITIPKEPLGGLACLNIQMKKFFLILVQEQVTQTLLDLALDGVEAGCFTEQEET